ncbi:hypothetical protein Y032_0302g1865 [Ancylostoma ceylanicum]|nr:hypothetical protein Y032_0302g1865 [Ancylostoma ceylanicum]
MLYQDPTVLMRSYHRLNFSKRFKPGSKLPQIIGLTASLGVGGASNEVDAANHVVGLCACLDCTVISTVRRNVHQLQEFSPIVVDEVRFCNDESDSARLRFIQTICDFMDLFEEKLYELYGKHTTLTQSNPSATVGATEQNRPYAVYHSFSRAPADKLSQGYLNWVSNHLRRVVPETKFTEESAKTQAVEVLEILYDLYRTIEMYQDFSTAVAFGYLREQIEKKEKSLTDFSLRHWQDYSQKLAACQSPDSVLISELVNQLCANKDVDFRAIVFVRTRKGASILANLLNSHTDLISCNIRVETIAGLNNSGVDTTTKREQLEKLKRFRDGDTRVLVATSVADEGLDVAKCNLVIKYNYASNEIAHVQRRGRGRAENSRSILLTQNTKLKEQEEKNIVKERLMRRVLRAIEENRIDLVARVREAAEDLWLEIQREDDTESRRIAEQKSLGIVYSLLCSKCDETLCTSKDIKTRNSQYCVCNPSFWSKVRNEEICGDVREARYGAVAKLFCVRKNCQNLLGRVVCIEGTLMPVLSSSAFVLEFKEGGSGNTTRRTVRKWKEVLKDYFTPETIRNYDLAVMTEASNKPVISSAGVCFHFI